MRSTLVPPHTNRMRHRACTRKYAETGTLSVITASMAVLATWGGGAGVSKINPVHPHFLTNLPTFF
jgi:actin-related protein